MPIRVLALELAPSSNLVLAPSFALTVELTPNLELDASLFT
jgi:hypothetical protein